MSVLDITDEIIAILEPDKTLRDDAAAEPVVVDAGRMYLWPSRETFGAADTGQTDEQWFYLTAMWVTESPETDERDRAVTEIVIAKADAIASLVRANRAGDTFEWLQVDEVDYEIANTHDARGFQMRLSGYIYRAD